MGRVKPRTKSASSLGKCWRSSAAHVVRAVSTACPQDPDWAGTGENVRAGLCGLSPAHTDPMRLQTGATLGARGVRRML
eukprot:CAMPEP_0114258004 /NCGR_PEP_ID=MMETSP0058-20121206/19060_1 /TAXON_ID=36894 /ORGANISM="Pyramimonas parkeae, CCMP726" /LENGTH=78 /DNA_ID=CAMNT_0001372819 /DNA_START=140 /DNA_END=376 /DNA_ORIENTATION=-